MRRHIVAHCLGGATLVAVACLAAGLKPSTAVGATDTQFMLFNQTPAGSYQVRRNGGPAATRIAAPSGLLVHSSPADPLDRFEFLLGGLSPVSPSRPTGVVATGDQGGCVRVSWTPPASAEYVSDYSLLWGSPGGALSDSVRIDGIDIAKGAAWVASHCGFASGTYAFALRAHNAFDRWSPVSVSSVATIGNQDTQGPAPPTNLRVIESSFGCAALTWTRSSDVTVVGYRVYFGARRRTQAAYTDSLDAGNAAAANRCNLAEGDYYFSVRAYTESGVTSAYSQEVHLAARGVDVAAPTITQRVPAPGATNVARNTSVFFVATDDKTGVDTGSIEVTVNGSPQGVETSPAVDGIAVQCDPPGDLPANTDITVEVTMADRATPANTTTRTWSFRTGSSSVTDTDPPTITAVSPAEDAEGVASRPTIEVRVRDSGLGLDFASLSLEVDGDAVAFTLEGTPADAYLRYRPDTPWPAMATIDVHVEACDRAATPNCASLDYRFTVGAATAVAEGSGAIVPDGYWADDPARPLEIRNLPRQWVVRIFDASGASVRRHESTADGATWTWNFRNDDGGRVAPALYLVRVTDANGAVQRSGRFLVQSLQ
jgi:hypothetical protein